jgi:urea transport system ATP-binding protein
MMDVITGKTRPDEGSVWFGRNINLLELTEPAIAEAGVGRKFQKPTVFENLTVFDNLELALAGPKSFWKMLVARLAVADRERIDAVLETIGLTNEYAAQASTLSHGQKQWLEIGMLLMQQPDLLLVDEPVAGMTPQETERTAELLLSLAGKHSVIVVEHDMEFVRSIAGRVTVLHEGSVLAEGDMETIQNEPACGARGEPVVRREPHAVGRRHGRDARVAHVRHGSQRHGKDDAAQMHHGAAADDIGPHRIRRHRDADACGRGPRAPRDRLRSAGTRDLLALDG